MSFRDAAVVLPPGRYGPVAPMMSGLLDMARTGSLDADLLASPQFYGTDYTKPLLFIADGSFLAAEAATQHLQGDQWGMMNETGNYPGPGLAVALHHVVPGLALLDLLVGQCRRSGVGVHDAAHPGPAPRAVHPRGCARSPGWSRYTGSSGATTTAGWPHERQGSTGSG